MTALSINLTSARICGGFEHCRDGEHDPTCEPRIYPVLIFCPIPRSVTFGDCPEAVQAMRPQRDAVFAALADMARAEEEARQAQRALVEVLDESGASYSTSWSVRNAAAERGLAAYVERLIEQVGALP